MKKETYERTKLDLIRFKAEDVLTTSGDEYELEREMILPPMIKGD